MNGVERRETPCGGYPRFSQQVCSLHLRTAQRRGHFYLLSLQKLNSVSLKHRNNVYLPYLASCSGATQSINNRDCQLGRAASTRHTFHSQFSALETTIRQLFELPHIQRKSPVNFSQYSPLAWFPLRLPTVSIAQHSASDTLRNLSSPTRSSQPILFLLPALTSVARSPCPPSAKLLSRPLVPLSR